MLRAGTDVDCGSFVSDNAESALSKGLITEEDLNDRLAMQLRMRMRLSHFDPLNPLNEIPRSVICSLEGTLRWASTVNLSPDPNPNPNYNPNPNRVSKAMQLRAMGQYKALRC